MHNLKRPLQAATALSALLLMTGCEDSVCIERNQTALSSLVQKAALGLCDIKTDDTNLTITCSDAALIGSSRGSLRLAFSSKDHGFELHGNTRAELRCGAHTRKLTDPEKVAIVKRDVFGYLAQLEID